MVVEGRFEGETRFSLQCVISSLASAAARCRTTSRCGLTCNAPEPTSVQAFVLGKHKGFKGTSAPSHPKVDRESNDEKNDAKGK